MGLEGQRKVVTAEVIEGVKRHREKMLDGLARQSNADKDQRLRLSVR